MEILQEKTGSKLVMKLIGNLNTVTAEQLEEALKNALDGVTELIFDFEKLQYLTSAGIRVLTSTCVTMNEKGSMKIINVKKNEVIYEVFRVTNLIEALNVE